MELIYTDAQWHDLAVVAGCELDCEFGPGSRNSWLNAPPTMRRPCQTARCSTATAARSAAWSTASRQTRAKEP